MADATVGMIEHFAQFISPGDVSWDAAGETKAAKHCYLIKAPERALLRKSRGDGSF